MKTITITVPVSPEVVEREITLPAYRVTGNDEGYFKEVVKIIDENTVCKCWINETGGVSVSTIDTNVGSFFTNSNYRASTESEFQSHLERGIELIKNFQLQTI